MLCDDSTSIDCARVIRGTSSSASAVTLAIGERFRDVGAVAGPQQRKERRARIHAGDLVGARRLDLGDDVRAGERGGGVGGDRRASAHVGVVAKAGAQAGATLNDDFELLLLDQPRDTVRRERDAQLARSGFRWDADSH